MNTNKQTVRITVTTEEKAIIEKLSRKSRMTSAQFVKALLFDSGILTPQADGGQRGTM